MLLAILLPLLFDPQHWVHPKGSYTPDALCDDGRVINGFGEVVTGRLAIDHHAALVRKNGGKEPAKVQCK